MFKSVYTPNYDNFKCGEIFYVSTPDVFNVSCEICNQNLLLDEFVTHFQTHHFNLLEEAISIKLEDNDGSENYMASQGDLIPEHEAVLDHDVVSECSNVVLEDDVVAEDADVVAEDEGILENSFKQEDSDDYVSNNINYDENQQDLRFDYVGKQHKTEDDVYMQEIQIKSKKGTKYKRNSPSKSKPISRNSNNSRVKHTARKRTAGVRQKTSTDTSDPIDVPAALPFSKQLTKNACIRENNIGPDESDVPKTNKRAKDTCSIVKSKKLKNTVKESSYKHKCEECNESFRTIREFTKHKRSHTGIICDICFKPFTRLTTMKLHKLRHTGIKDYKCNDCPKEFYTKLELKQHIICHTGLMPAVCDICGKRCRSGGALTVHKRRHTGERPAKCDVCGKCFYTNYNLNIHALSHKEERPFECDICGANFHRKSTLQTHKLIHLKNRRYICKICGNSFAQPAGLHSHMRTHNVAMAEESEIGQTTYTFELVSKGRKEEICQEPNEVMVDGYTEELELLDEYE